MDGFEYEPSLHDATIESQPASAQRSTVMKNLSEDDCFRTCRPREGRDATRVASQ
jgi:hypothetical protein